MKYVIGGIRSNVLRNSSNSVSAIVRRAKFVNWIIHTTMTAMKNFVYVQMFSASHDCADSVDVIDFPLRTHTPNVIKMEEISTYSDIRIATLLSHTRTRETHDYYDVTVTTKRNNFDQFSIDKHNRLLWLCHSLIGAIEQCGAALESFQLKNLKLRQE